MTYMDEIQMDGFSAHKVQLPSAGMTESILLSMYFLINRMSRPWLSHLKL